RHDLRRAGQHVAAVGDEADPLEDQQRQRGEDDDRQEADRSHAALPPMPGRIASCCSAECNRLCGSSLSAICATAAASTAASATGAAWCAFAAAVMRAIFWTSCEPTATCPASSVSHLPASAMRSCSDASVSSAVFFSSPTAVLARLV